MDVDALIGGVIAREGGYVNHPHDRGGPTIWGVTERVARANGYRGAMVAMRRETAISIYRSQYWTAPHLNLVAMAAPMVAEELFDTAVNMGAAVAGEFLQRALNVLTSAKLKIDGRIGPRTLDALKGYLSQRRNQDGEAVLFKAVECQQGHRYIELAEGRMKNRSFIYGWLRHRIGNVA